MHGWYFYYGKSSENFWCTAGTKFGALESFSVERLPRLGWFWRGMLPASLGCSVRRRPGSLTAPSRFWQGLVIFHGNLNKEWLEGILEETGMSGVVLKPLGVDNLTRELYSSMFCDARFYDNFPTSHVLVFQTDVMMRRRIPAKFFDFAYVGAPFHGPRGMHLMHGGLKCVGNGGYSLRNVEEMKRLLEANNMVEWNQQQDADAFAHEDVFIGARSNPARLPLNQPANFPWNTFGIRTPQACTNRFCPDVSPQPHSSSKPARGRTRHGLRDAPTGLCGRTGSCRRTCWKACLSA